MSWIRIVPPDRTPIRRMKSATGGASDGSDEEPAIRSTTGPAAAASPPALSPTAAAVQPEAAAAARASAKRQPPFASFISGSRQGDVQLEDGPVRREREHFAVRAEGGRPDQGDLRTRPFRD